MDKNEINPPVYVTKPSLPPLEEFIPYLQSIWSNAVLTNGGPMHQQLEAALCDYLGVKHISLFSNGTLGLVTALQAMRIVGEVITTPYSFVATSHALLWNGIKPVFVDVDSNTLNIDANKIERAITKNTTAILPVHCYGNPCAVDQIQKIADNYNLKIIYDAAHAFGVKGSKGSLLNYGDLSVLSFHATKVFNTFEGGAIISPDAKTKRRIDHLKNFGFVDEVTVVASGINAKMSEVNAAFGLLQLRYIDDVLNKRARIDSLYRIGLQDIKGVEFLNFSSEFTRNYSYFPIFIRNASVERDELYFELKRRGIHARRYFYPLISDFPMYRDEGAGILKYPVATQCASEVICLPIYPDLQDSEIFRVIDLIKNICL